MTENPDLLNYLGQPFETTELDGQLWLRADEIGQVMGLTSVGFFTLLPPLCKMSNLGH